MQLISFSRLGIGVCVLLALLYGARIAQADNAGHLLVADPAAAKLYVYSVPALELEAEFSEIRGPSIRGSSRSLAVAFFS